MLLAIGRTGVARFSSIPPCSMRIMKGGKIPRRLRTELMTLAYFTVSMAVALLLRQWLALLWRSPVLTPSEFQWALHKGYVSSVIFVLCGFGGYAFGSVVLTLRLGQSSDLLRACACATIIILCFLASGYIVSGAFFVIPTLWSVANGITTAGCLCFPAVRDKLDQARNTPRS